MEISGLQNWVEENFDGFISAHSRELALAFLLEQTGQLAEAVLQGDPERVAREAADVLLVVLAIAHKEEIDLTEAVQARLLSRSAADILENVHG
jgi:NTP pyrophosphatase (non-canonical NTP hydrolase)